MVSFALVGTAFEGLVLVTMCDDLNPLWHLPFWRFVVAILLAVSVAGIDLLPGRAGVESSSAHF